MISDFQSSSWTFSTVAMVKTKILDSVGQPTGDAVMHRLLPKETAVVFDVKDIGTGENEYNVQVSLRHRVIEAKIALLAEFLDDCTPKSKAASTIRHIGTGIPRSKIHEIHQTRLAASMYRVSTSDDPFDAQLLDAIVDCRMFDLYAGLPDMHGDNLRQTWLANANARAQIQDTLLKHVNKLLSAANTSPLLARA
ncbi:hypothetical protein DFH09DRAFT_1334327 [Mycena vulgaris]|nr:hypothetical protein DFH09DRAFT_1334327 [Mycena vulgaris]